MEELNLKFVSEQYAVPVLAGCRSETILSSHMEQVTDVPFSTRAVNLLITKTN